MDDELEQWCLRWIAKGESPKDVAKMLRYWAKQMDCRAKEIDG